MVDHTAQLPSRRMLVMMPSWVGDIVMATPTLRALRQSHPEAHITALLRRPLKPLLVGCQWVDRIATVRTRPARPLRARRSTARRRGAADGNVHDTASPSSGRGRNRQRARRRDLARRAGMVTLARRLRLGRFDTAVLLTNSFRTALLCRMAAIPRRVGYDRDGRGFLLTDRLLPRRSAGHFVPVSSRDYYLAIARYLGAIDPDPTMRLFTTPQDDALAARRLEAAGIGPDRRLVVITPGANYGDAKMWDPQRFAAVADRCVRKLGAAVAVCGAPREQAIIESVVRNCREPAVNLLAAGVELKLLKSVIRRASVVVTNDTGPRHVAIAVGTPVVTIFGPTDPAWTEVGFTDERQVMVEVFCGPCQKKRCPLDHRCMTQVTADMVFARVVEITDGSAGAPAPAPAVAVTVDQT